MFLSSLIVTLVLLLHPMHSMAGGKHKNVIVHQPLVTPDKCSACAGASDIRCGKDVGGKGINCECGDDHGWHSCPDECCESTPQECCADTELSTAYECTQSSCWCDGPHISSTNCKTAPVTCCPSFIRNGRRAARDLKEVSNLVFAGTEEEYKQLVESCGDHDYDVSLYVSDTHFFGMATRESDVADNVCPNLIVTHVNFDEDGPATKELLGWFDKTEGMEHFPKESAPIGRFKVKELTSAFESAKPSGAGKYDYLTNNCADFMINMANELGVKVDSNITRYVTRRLLQDSGSALIGSMKESAGFLSFFEGRRLRADVRDLRDDEVVELVVESRVSDLLA